MERQQRRKWRNNKKEKLKTLGTKWFKEKKESKEERKRDRKKERNKERKQKPGLRSRTKFTE